MPRSRRDRRGAHRGRGSQARRADRPHGPILSRLPLPFDGHGRPHRIGAAQGVRGRSAVRQRVLHGRAQGPPLARRSQRRRQDDAPARDRRRDVDPGRQARIPEGTRESRCTTSARRSSSTSASASTRSPGARDLLEVEDELRGSSRRWRTATTTTRRCGAMPRRRRGSSTRAAGPGATALRRGARPRLRRRRARPAARHVLRRRADARVARARACWQPGPPPPRRADEPPRRQNLEWLERELETIDAAVILVAHDRWFLEAVTTSRARARAGRRALLLGAVARVAPGTRDAGRGSREDRESRVRRHRPARALRRAVPLQEVEGEAGAGEARRRSRGSRRSARRHATRSSR